MSLKLAAEERIHKMYSILRLLDQIAAERDKPSFAFSPLSVDHASYICEATNRNIRPPPVDENGNPPKFTGECKDNGISALYIGNDILLQSKCPHLLIEHNLTQEQTNNWINRESNNIFERAASTSSLKFTLSTVARCPLELKYGLFDEEIGRFKTSLNIWADLPFVRGYSYGKVLNNGKIRGAILEAEGGYKIAFIMSLVVKIDIFARYPDYIGDRLAELIAAPKRTFYIHAPIFNISQTFRIYPIVKKYSEYSDMMSVKNVVSYVPFVFTGDGHEYSIAERKNYRKRIGAPPPNGETIEKSPCDPIIKFNEPFLAFVLSPNYEIISIGKVDFHEIALEQEKERQEEEMRLRREEEEKLKKLGEEDNDIEEFINKIMKMRGGERPLE